MWSMLSLLKSMSSETSATAQETTPEQASGANQNSSSTSSVILPFEVNEFEPENAVSESKSKTSTSSPPTEPLAVSTSQSNLLV